MKGPKKSVLKRYNQRRKRHGNPKWKKWWKHWVEAMCKGYHVKVSIWNMKAMHWSKHHSASEMYYIISHVACRVGKQSVSLSQERTRFKLLPVLLLTSNWCNLNQKIKLYHVSEIQIIPCLLSPITLYI